ASDSSSGWPVIAVLRMSAGPARDPSEGLSGIKRLSKLSASSTESAVVRNTRHSVAPFNTSPMKDLVTPLLKQSHSSSTERFSALLSGQSPRGPVVAGAVSALLLAAK